MNSKIIARLAPALIGIVVCYPAAISMTMLDKDDRLFAAFFAIVGAVYFFILYERWVGRRFEKAVYEQGLTGNVFIGHVSLFVGAGIGAFGFSEFNNLIFLIGGGFLLISHFCLTATTKNKSSVSNKTTKNLSFRNESLFNRLKARLLFIYINRSLNAAGLAGVSMCFGSKLSAEELRVAAANTSIYTFEKGCLNVHYYYSEPGNPYSVDSYDSIAEFLYKIGRPLIQASCTLRSAMLIASPSMCEQRYLRDYINVKNKTKSSQVEHILLQLEVATYISWPFYRKLDFRLASFYGRAIDALVFNCLKFRGVINILNLFRTWKNKLNERIYDKNTIIKKWSVAEEIKTATVNYKILSVFGNVILTQLESKLGELPKEERLFFNKDGSLNVMDEYGISVFKVVD